MKSLQFLDLADIERAFRAETLAAKAEADAAGLKTTIGTNKTGMFHSEPGPEEQAEADKFIIPRKSA